MRIRGALLLAPLLVLTLLGLVPSGASGGGASHISAKNPSTQWKGTITHASPVGCESPNPGCDTHTLVVTAPRGQAVTVRIHDAGNELHVLYDGYSVADAGTDLNPLVTTGTGATQSTVVFRQVEAGRVPYTVVVGNAAATPLGPARYTVKASIGASQGHDSNLACTVANLDGTQDTGMSKTSTLRVRLVGAPADAAPIRKAGRGLVEIYARIGVPVRVSYDFFTWKLEGHEGYPWQAVQRHYGGYRPAGVDVVDVMTDDFAGGVAACIGGVRSPDRAFANSQLTYKTEGVVALRKVPPALLAAHEIGHLLGAQHNQSNCAEAVPQQASAPASDGSFGPCTIMGPLAYQDSETFSTLERNTVRTYVNRFAGR